MIKLNGKYDTGDLYSIKCDIEIKKGMLKLIKNDIKIGNVTSPVKKRDYEIIKTEDENGLPITHKYAIKFTDYYDKERYVFTDMTLMQKWWIEIRKSNKKFNLFKTILSVLGFLFVTSTTFILNDAYNILKPKMWYNTNPINTPDNTIHKLDSASKNDHTIIKNNNQIDSVKTNNTLKTDTTDNF